MYIYSLYEILHPKYMKLFACANISVKTLLLIGTCPLNAVTLDFNGNISIQNCFVVFYRGYNALYKSSSESDRSTWLSANSSVSSFISVTF